MTASGLNYSIYWNIWNILKHMDLSVSLQIGIMLTHFKAAYFWVTHMNCSELPNQKGEENEHLFKFDSHLSFFQR